MFFFSELLHERGILSEQFSVLIVQLLVPRGLRASRPTVLMSFEATEMYSFHLGFLERICPDLFVSGLTALRRLNAEFLPLPEILGPHNYAPK